MPILVSCSCKASFSVPDAAAGRKGKCPKCGASLEVPSRAPSSALSGGGFELRPVCGEPVLQLLSPEAKLLGAVRYSGDSHAIVDLFEKAERDFHYDASDAQGSPLFAIREESAWGGKKGIVSDASGARIGLFRKKVLGVGTTEIYAGETLYALLSGVLIGNGAVATFSTPDKAALGSATLLYGASDKPDRMIVMLDRTLVTKDPLVALLLAAAVSRFNV